MLASTDYLFSREGVVMCICLQLNKKICHSIERTFCQALNLCQVYRLK